MSYIKAKVDKRNICEVKLSAKPVDALAMFQAESRILAEQLAAYKGISIEKAKAFLADVVNDNDVVAL